MPPLITIDLLPDTAATPAWTLRPPPAALAGLTVSAHRVTIGDDGVSEADLASVRDDIRRLADEGSAPLVLLSGAPRRQLALMAALQAANLCSRMRPVLCVAAQHRPLLPESQRFVHGLIVDNPPTAAEAAHWACAFHRDIGAQLYRVPPADDADGAPAGEAGAGGSPQVTLVALEADAWMALGIQAFKIWADGCFRHCGTCAAISLDRFYPHDARFVPREACLYCGSAALAPPAR